VAGLLVQWFLVTAVASRRPCVEYHRAGSALRKEVGVEWWLVAAGVLSVLAGVIIATAPGAGALGLLWLIGAYAIVFGITLVGLAFRLRRHSHEPHGHAAAA